MRGGLRGNMKIEPVKTYRTLDKMYKVNITRNVTVFN